MRTIAPINSGFLLSSALLILCLACAHANGEVNSKELLDDAGLDLETNDVESTSAIATQTTHGGPCKPFCAKNTKGWTTKCKWKKCTGCSVCSTGGQKACFFCGIECPATCWNALQDILDDEFDRRSSSYTPASHSYGWVAKIPSCMEFIHRVRDLGNLGSPEVEYRKALTHSAKKYLGERMKGKERKEIKPPDGGWLEYGMKGSAYCDMWKCAPMEYAKAGSSSARCPGRSCSSFGHRVPCNLARPRCKWVAGHQPRVNPPWWVDEHCAEAGEVELLQTTDNTADKTETADTMRTVKRSNELDRLLDDVQMEAKWGVGGSTDCW